MGGFDTSSGRGAMVPAVQEEKIFTALTATTPTFTFNTNIYNLTEVRIDGVVATVTTDYTVSNGVITPVGATADEVFTVVLSSKKGESRSV